MYSRQHDIFKDWRVHSEVHENKRYDFSHKWWLIIEEVESKIRRLLSFPGSERIERLYKSQLDDVIHAVEESICRKYGDGNSYNIGFHLTDWNSDAAFLLALLLYPEEFSHEEIEEGIEGFLIHAPNHMASAAKLAGYPVQDIFD